MPTLNERFEEILKGLSGCSFEEPPLYMGKYFRQAVYDWLEEKRLMPLSRKPDMIEISDLQADCKEP
jgi:hypothetical protein